jgi:hypothetical protein
MAIRFERSGTRAVLVQRRRPLRVALWTVALLALVGTVMMVVDGLSARHTRLTCRRAEGRCEVDEGARGGRRTIPLADITGVRLEGERGGQGGRIAAVIARAGAPGSYQLCEAEGSDPEAAGIRDAVRALGGFLADPAAAEIAVACDSRYPGDSPGAIALRAGASLAGVGFMLLGMVIFLIEVRTEIDRGAGLVKVAGRSALPRRRWSVERGLGEVDAVLVQRRGRGRSRSYAIYLRFTDGSGVLVLTPATGRIARIEGWMAELRAAIGLPAPAAAG